MVKAGCQRIVMITGYDNSDSPTELRQLGFNYELDKKGIICPVPKRFYLSCDEELEIKSIISREKPDGIFVSDDLTAILIMKMAKQMDISIPDDLKIIGYDGTAFIRHFYPEPSNYPTTLWTKLLSFVSEILLKGN